MKLVNPIIILLVLVFSLLIVSCYERSDSGNLKVHLVQEIEDTPLVLNEWIYQAPAGHPYKLRRLQMLFSDFSLHSVDGSVHSFDMYHYFEFGRSETKSFVLSDIPFGTYDKISFVFGLDENKNFLNAYPQDFDMINFKWPEMLGGGYHYMRFELTADSLGSGVIKDFNLHTGPTDGNQNYISVTLLMEEIVIDGNEFEMDLIADLNKWLQGPNIYDFEDFGHGIMNNQNAQDLLKENGHDVFEIDGPFLEIEYFK